MTTTTQVVADVMTPEVIGVSPSALVTEAAELMREYDVGDVLVVEDNRVRGIVTDRDLAVRVLAVHLEPESTTVSEVCSEDLVSVLPDLPVPEAVELMREYAVRRLPVIAADGRPHGVVTIGDLAVTEDPQSALADISAAPPNK
jgi:CBS domain-containing protein